MTGSPLKIKFIAVKQRVETQTSYGNVRLSFNAFDRKKQNKNRNALQFGATRLMRVRLVPFPAGSSRAARESEQMSRNVLASPPCHKKTRPVPLPTFVRRQTRVQETDTNSTSPERSHVLQSSAAQTSPFPAERALWTTRAFKVPI